MTYFMDCNGLRIKRQNDILNEMLSESQAYFKIENEIIDASPDSLLGCFYHIISAQLTDTWLGVQEVYDSFNPNINEGKNLDDSGALSNIERLKASHTKVLVSLKGKPGTTIPKGFEVKCTINNEIFCCDETVILSVKNCTDFTLGENEAIEFVTNTSIFTAKNSGPIICPPNTIELTTTKIQGLDSVYNPKDIYVLGRNLETDTEFRIRRAKSGSIIGQNVLLALKSKLENVKGVLSVDVLENCINKTSPDGLPPHSFNVIIEGGDDNEIANVIWQNKPTGIQTYGTKKVHVLITTNQNFDIYFSRPVNVPILVKVYIETNDEFTKYGEQQIIDCIFNYGNSIGINKDVIDQKFFGNIYKSCDGIVNLKIELARKSDNIYTNRIQIGRIEHPSFSKDEIHVYKKV